MNTGDKFLITKRRNLLEVKYDLIIGVGVTKGIYKPIQNYRYNTSLGSMNTFSNQFTKPPTLTNKLFLRHF